MQTSQAIKTFVEETGGWVASQLEACTRCGICAEACHFYQATGNPDFAPVWKVELLKRAYEQEFTLGGRLKRALRLIKPIDDEDLLAWSKIVYEACTVCNKCALVCPMGIQLGPIIHDVRSGLAAAGMVPEDLAAAVAKQLEEGSPLGVTDDVFEERLDWVQDEWDFDLPIDKEGADTLVIFSSIEIMKFPENIADIARLLDAAGENWTLSTKAREVVNFGFYEGSHEHTRLLLQRVFDGQVPPMRWPIRIGTTTSLEIDGVTVQPNHRRTIHGRVWPGDRRVDEATKHRPLIERADLMCAERSDAEMLR